MRAPYQVLILPYRWLRDGLRVAVLRRAGESMWQFISGGGEDDESPVEAAQREMHEEAGLNVEGRLRVLDAMTTIRKDIFEDSDCWRSNPWVIPEYCFAVDVEDAPLILSQEHEELRWVTVDHANVLLTWDSNRTALWELCSRLQSET